MRPRGVYPASTGIGMSGSGLVASCMALETQRDDVFLLPLENPQQTPAYAYDPSHSPQSPKFSRAVALVLGNYVTTWVSGTASIVDSESRHLGDPEKQTAQTIDNIERLICRGQLRVSRPEGGGRRAARSGQDTRLSQAAGGPGQMPGDLRTAFRVGARYLRRGGYLPARIAGRD